MSPKVAKFSDGERILCFHGPLMYEAKCIRSELRDGGKGYYYLIHYNGWNKHWDEWVPEARVLKYNDSNLQKQKDILKQHRKDRTKRGKPSKPNKAENGKDVTDKSKKVEPVTSSEPKKKKSRVDLSGDLEGTVSSKAEINITIPDELKPILVDDWDLITRQKSLFNLPAKLTVEDILNSYMKAESIGRSIEKISSVKELVAGIKDYFNTMLGSQLLYKLERLQHNEMQIKYPDLTMAQIYGMPHLLRFFVKFDSALAFTNLNERNMSTLVGHVQPFLTYLQENISSLFDNKEYVSLSDNSK